MSADEAGLPAFYGEWGGVVECDAIVRIGKILRCEPPRNGVVLHGFEDEAGRQQGDVAFHHFRVEAAYRLDLAQRIRIIRVGIPYIEVIGAPGLGVRVLVPVRRDGQQGIRLVIHEISAELAGGVGKPARVPFISGCQENHC